MEDITPTQNKRLKHFKHEMIKIDCNKVSFNRLIQKLDDAFPNCQIFTYTCEKPRFRFDFPSRFSKNGLNNANMFILKDKENILIEGFLYGSKKNFVLHIFIEPFNLEKIKILARVLNGFDIKLPTRFFHERKHIKEIFLTFLFIPIFFLIIGISLYFGFFYSSYFIYILIAMLVMLIILLVNLVILHTSKKKAFDEKIFDK